MALFQQAKQAATKSQNNYIAEIRCGRMNMDAATGMVEPELEKGLLYVHRSRDDMLVHLCWKSRKTDSGPPVDDLIVFEGDCTVKQIKQLPDHRVFFVKMTQVGMRKFYWFQHTEKETDDQLIKDLNMALNDTVAAESKKKASASTSKKQATGNRGLDQLSSLLGNANGNEVLNQLMQSGALGPDGMAQLVELVREQTEGEAGMSGTRTPSAITSNTRLQAATSAANAAVEDTPVSSNTNQKGSKKVEKLKMGDLANAFSMVKNTTQYDLTKVLGTDSLVAMLGNKDVQDRLNEHMPKEDKISGTPENIRAAVGSPQYQQAVQAFQEALESGQLGPVLAQFQLPKAAVKAAGTGNVKAFAKAMEGVKESENKEESSSTTAKPDAKVGDDEKANAAEKPDEDKKDEPEKEVDDEEDKMAVD